MKTLWHKGNSIHQLVHQFTIGDDWILDKELIKYDCLGSIAHAYMLNTIGVISVNEFLEIQKALAEVIHKPKDCLFEIRQEDEDVHTALENYLVVKLGTIGKKIHTCRSRNDQVALDLRLYMRDQLLSTARASLNLCSILHTLAKQHIFVPMAGRTHFQKAMPSSVGLWLGSYLESMVDNLIMLQHAFGIINQCPLGSASGFGVNIPIDRQLVSDLLDFDNVQNNVLYVANSRGKFEGIVLQVLASTMIDLSKLATDIIIMSTPEFGYITLPDFLCTGSSLMPQKKNPDALELIRAKTSTVLSFLVQVFDIIKGLPSGYNRDYQETKRPLIEGFLTVRGSLDVMHITMENLIINREQCINSCTPEIFATDEVLNNVKKGIPFRDAYKNLDLRSNDGNYDPVANIMSKNHIGATGNLGLELSQQSIQEIAHWVQEKEGMITSKFAKLIELK